MNGAEIQKHIKCWLTEDSNPYIGIKRSWEDYCKENQIDLKESIGILLSTLQIHQIRSNQIEEAIFKIQNKSK